MMATERLRRKCDYDSQPRLQPQQPDDPITWGALDDDQFLEEGRLWNSKG